MNKKILIGSITAVVILVLVSFTGIGGYQTISSTIAKVSPLFTIRTNRAIGVESKNLNCNYTSKRIMLPFPNRDEKNKLTEEIVDSIRKMDDKTYEKFIATIIDFAQKDIRFNNVNSDKIKEALYLLRYSDMSIPIFNANQNNHTIGFGLKGYFLCILLIPFWLIEIIVFIILLFWLWCGNPAWTSMPCRTGKSCPRTLDRLP